MSVWCRSPRCVIVILRCEAQPELQWMTLQAASGGAGEPQVGHVCLAVIDIALIRVRPVQRDHGAIICSSH